jgi:hypothetical protein
MLRAGEAGPIARIGKGQTSRDRRDAERICQFWLGGQNRLLSTSNTLVTAPAPEHPRWYPLCTLHTLRSAMRGRPR